MYYESVAPTRAGVNSLTEQISSAKQRVYRKVKRAEDEQRTRARIVDAAEALHAEVGPARTTISAIAERADVTRATVYRHFPDDESLFLACSGQWLSRQALPDPEAWDADGDPFAAQHQLRTRHMVIDAQGFERLVTANDAESPIARLQQPRPPVAERQRE